VPDPRDQERELPGDVAGAARRELADAIRALIPAALLTTADPGAMVVATELVRDAAAQLSASVRASRYEGVQLAPGIGVNDAAWETHAIYGRSQALAPPLYVTEEEPGRVVGTVTFGAAYEGGPGQVYGGFVASIFDGACGRAVIATGRLAVTRSLLVRFLRPTPLYRELRVEAAVGARKGDDVEIMARMWSGATLTSEAEASFRIVDPERYRR
jgi:acyl-coenzyme A thioesterase PaaI-like protein